MSFRVLSKVLVWEDRVGKVKDHTISDSQKLHDNRKAEAHPHHCALPQGWVRCPVFPMFIFWCWVSKSRYLPWIPRAGSVTPQSWFSVKSYWVAEHLEQREVQRRAKSRQENSSAKLQHGVWHMVSTHPHSSAPTYWVGLLFYYHLRNNDHFSQVLNLGTLINWRYFLNTHCTLPCAQYSQNTSICSPQLKGT